MALDIKFKHDLFLHENRGHDFTSPFTIPNDSASLGDILHYYNLPAGGCRAAESRIEENAGIWVKLPTKGPVTGLCELLPPRSYLDAVAQFATWACGLRQSGLRSKAGELRLG